MDPERAIRIGFIGCVAEGRRSLETLLDLRETVAAVFTLRPDLAASVSGAVPWEDITAEHGIPLHYVRNMNDPEPVATLRALAPDLVFCVGWTQLLKREVLEIPRLGCLGFHASLLPGYRGRAPINWAIIRGEVETGNTLMVLDDGVDTGDIVAQRRFPIDDADTCATLYEKVARSEDDMIREVMPLVRAGRLPRVPQDHARATVMPRRRPEDGVIDWTRTTREIHDWVRALTHPYPGAFTSLSGRRVFVWKASRWRPGPGGPADAAPRPGWWRAAHEPPMLLADTGDGALRLERVQAEGEDEMDGDGFALRLPANGRLAGGTS
ncbi:MAG TPA: methionyl-tRNA formyltransferase [Candidatus Bathyarchaeia archaeon]|nr:methionyl-tRNA formyltransferase [Candidatus Bathyarchaeia archaeon]